jgi:catechol 2,3-dioxygenase-like lactoylglutathione lyase family enzyme
MRPNIRVVTLAVADLERALAFYRDGLGLASSGIIATEFHDEVSGADGAIAMFELDGGLLLSLYPRTDLAKDAGVAADATSRTEFSLGHVVESREEVDGRARSGRGRRCSPAGWPTRAALGHLFGLLPGPRRPSLGGDLGAASRQDGVSRPRAHSCRIRYVRCLEAMFDDLRE